MRRFRCRHSAALAAILAGVQLVQPVLCVAQVPRFMRSKTTVEKLAEKIDELQKHIDHYGTVVAKTPDVWGQSRLMQHRVEFENEMHKELDQFQLTLNASEQVSDGAFLSSALSFQQALGPDGTKTTVVEGGKTTITEPSPPQFLTQGILPELFPTDATKTAQAEAAAEAVRIAAGGGSKFAGRAGDLGGVTLEPTLYLDQKQRYLDHLNALRRINEGDDTADAPGYALNLVRVPVSVFPGKKTEHGYGAEITLSIKPHLTEDLLPNAFRDLVINDVAARLAMPVFKVADEADIDVMKGALTIVYASPAYQPKEYKDPSKPNNIQSTSTTKPNDTQFELFLRAYGLVDILLNCPTFDQRLAVLSPEVLRYLIDKKDEKKAGPNCAGPIQTDVNSEKDGSKKIDAHAPYPYKKFVAEFADRTSPEFGDVYAARASDALRQISRSSGGNVSGTAKRSKLSISETQQSAVNGVTIFRVGVDAYDHLAEPECVRTPDNKTNRLPPIPPHRRGLNFLDVQAWLHRELQSAYELLSQPQAACLWNCCGPELARAVREHRREVPPGSRFANLSMQEGSLPAIRSQFFSDIGNFFPQAKDSTTADLAWHIIVESSLLNEHLAEDMAQLARTKSCPCQPPACAMFAGPNPPVESRLAFIEYVRCRWPIHVFALDPMTQDQNVGEAFSRRREMQLALAVAAGSRRTNLQSVSRFIRRMEYDLQTIELNRTAVGFSHGDDVCGWRFYPRVQAPRVPGNLELITREMLLGQMDRERMLNDRKLEPGIRECEAIVVMPSFLQFVTVDSRTNWFRLQDKCEHLPIARVMHREMNVSDAIDLSREMQNVHELSMACQRDAHKYRNGEAMRLVRAVETLDRQLPLQTAMVQMPYENTLGGFEMFSSGVTDLAPELHGWYGAPGVVVASTSDSYVDATAQVQDAAANAAKLQAAVVKALAAGKAAADVAPLVTAAQQGEVALTAATAHQAQAAAVPRSFTKLFLVGKNFSVIGTRVVAGGAIITPESDQIRLVNRQILEVYIPSVASPVYVDGQAMIDVHVATPYGVTSHIHIPVASAKSPCQAPRETNQADADKKAWGDAALQNESQRVKNTFNYNVGVSWQGQGAGHPSAAPAGGRPVPGTPAAGAPMGNPPASTSGGQNSSPMGTPTNTPESPTTSTTKGACAARAIPTDTWQLPSPVVPAKSPVNPVLNSVPAAVDLPPPSVGVARISDAGNELPPLGLPAPPRR